MDRDLQTVTKNSFSLKIQIPGLIELDLMRVRLVILISVMTDSGSERKRDLVQDLIWPQEASVTLFMSLIDHLDLNVTWFLTSNDSLSMRALDS